MKSKLSVATVPVDRLKGSSQDPLLLAELRSKGDLGTAGTASQRYAASLTGSARIIQFLLGSLILIAGVTPPPATAQEETRQESPTPALGTSLPLKDSSSSIATLESLEVSPTLPPPSTAQGGGDLDEVRPATAPVASSLAAESSSAPASDSSSVSSSPTHSASSPPSSEAQSEQAKPAYLKFLELQVDIAERAHSMSPTISTLSELVNSNEQIISAQCFESLRETLRYDGYPSDEDCRARIKRVLELDGTSSIANCAQFGIDSSECRQASALLSSGSFTIDSGLWRSTNGSMSGRVETISLREAIKQKSSSKQFTQQSEKIYQASLAARANPRNPSLTAKLEALARPALQEVCISPRLALEPLTPPTPTPSSYSDLSDIHSDSLARGVDNSLDTTGDAAQNDPFSDLIKSLDAQGGKRPAATPTPVTFTGPNFRRYRLVTDECDRIIRMVAEIAPSSPVVQCFRFGPVSAPCIQARRITPSAPAAPAVTAGAPKRVAPTFGETTGFESF